MKKSDVESSGLFFLIFLKFQACISHRVLRWWKVVEITFGMQTTNRYLRVFIKLLNLNRSHGEKFWENKFKWNWLNLKNWSLILYLNILEIDV